MSPSKTARPTVPVAKLTSRLNLISFHLDLTKKFHAQYDLDPDKPRQSYKFSHLPTGPGVQIIPNNRVDIEDLFIWYEYGEKKQSGWFGKYFVGRTVVWPLMKEDGGIQVVVEDENQSQCILVSLHFWILDEELDPMVLPQGTIILIKNPWLMCFNETTDAEQIGIRVDNPTEVEVIHIPPYHYDFIHSSFKKPLDLSVNKQLKEIPPEPISDYKDKGNKLFLKGKYHSAIRAYSFALQNDPTNAKADLLTRRSFCHLKVGRPENALEDAEQALKIDPVNTIGIMRKAIAFCRLDRHKEAHEFLVKHNKLVLANKDLLDVKKSIIQAYVNWDAPYALPSRVVNGCYTITKLPENCLKLVEIGFTPQKGRGLFINCDVEAGQVVLVWKAFEKLYQDFEPEVEITNELERALVDRAIASIAHRLKANPELIPQLYQVYAGPDYRPVVERSDVEGCRIDMNRIKQIIEYSGYGPVEHFVNLNVKGNIKTMKRLRLSLNLFPASAINHSCEPNLEVVEHGDIFIYTALKRISKGSELLISYSGKTGNFIFNERKEVKRGDIQNLKMFKRYGFKCNCRCCKLLPFRSNLN